MSYERIKPPHVDFEQSSVEDIRRYCAWYRDVAPERIALLRELVQQTEMFAAWRPDYTPDSLLDLGNWLRQRSTTVVVDDVAHTSPSHRMPDGARHRRLSPETFSYAFDCAMYLGEVFVKNDARLRWGVKLQDRKNVDFGQPVILGFPGNVGFNPTRLMINTAHTFAEGSCPGSRLRELYDIWMRMLPPLLKYH